MINGDDDVMCDFIDTTLGSSPKTSAYKEWIRIRPETDMLKVILAINTAFGASLDQAIRNAAYDVGVTTKELFNQQSQWVDSYWESLGEQLREAQRSAGSELEWNKYWRYVQDVEKWCASKTDSLGFLSVAGSHQSSGDILMEPNAKSNFKNVMDYLYVTDGKIGEYLTADEMMRLGLGEYVDPLKKQCFYVTGLYFTTDKISNQGTKYRPGGSWDKSNDPEDVVRTYIQIDEYGSPPPGLMLPPSIMENVNRDIERRNKEFQAYVNALNDNSKLYAAIDVTLSKLDHPTNNSEGWAYTPDIEIDLGDAGKIVIKGGWTKLY